MNRFLLQTLLALCTVLSCPLLAQEKNVPDLVGQPHYTEWTVFDSSSFYHRVAYNRPGSVDEEHVYTLQLRFSDLEKLKDGQALDLSTDTALVRCSYGVLSVWNWDYDTKASFSGTITIISKTKKEIVVEEDVRVRDREGKILIYRARKTFVPERKK
jgi:hypothetical protein